MSQHGFWLLLDGREPFLPFDEFPWFRQATVDAIIQLERPAPEHPYWPALMPTLRLARSSTLSDTR